MALMTRICDISVLPMVTRGSTLIPTMAFTRTAFPKNKMYSLETSFNVNMSLEGVSFKIVNFVVYFCNQLALTSVDVWVPDDNPPPPTSRTLYKR